MPDDRERWTLTFEATGDGPPTECRVRMLLKHALRTLGLKCIDLADSKRQQPTGETEDRQ